MVENLKKLSFILTNNQKNILYFFIFLLFLGLVLEVFGLGVLLPLMDLLLNDDPTNKSYIKPIIFFFNVHSKQNIVFLFLAIILLIYVVKTVFLFYLTYKQNRFFNEIQKELSIRLYESYLNLSYKDFLDKNKNILYKNLIIETNHFMTYCLALATMIIEGSLILVIILTLIFLEPFGALSVGIFFTAITYIFLKLTSLKVSQWGNLREELDQSLANDVSNGLGAYLELKLLGKESFYINNFSSNSNLKSRVNGNQAIVSQYPRFYLEFATVFALLAFVFVMIYLDNDYKSVLSTLSIFVAGSFRMIPSINRLVSTSQQLRFFNSSLEVIYSELKNVNEIKTNKKTNVVFNNKISLSKINYKIASNIIFKNLDLEILKGEMIGLIGESGSGKTTLLELIALLHFPENGSLTIDDLEINNLADTNWTNKIGYVSQNTFFTNESIISNIAFAIEPELIDVKKVIECVKSVRLDDMINNLKDGLNSLIGDGGLKLSTGQLQRLAIARMLYYEKELILLDEPTSSLDQKVEDEVMKVILSLKSKVTIIIAAHRLSTLEKCDIIYKLKNKTLKKIKLEDIHSK